MASEVESSGGSAGSKAQFPDDDARLVPLFSFASLKSRDDPLTVRRISPKDRIPVYLIENFATKEECEHIVSAASGKFQPSTAVENNSLVLREYRTSSTAFVTEDGEVPKDTVLRDVLNRVSGFTGFPITHIEGMNVVRYRRGERYDYHRDYFDAAHRAVMGPTGQRIWTFLLYLNSMSREAGGGTHFRKLGVRVHPRQGYCIAWPNSDLAGATLFDDTEHAGEAVLNESTKYAVNIWVRKRCFCCNHDDEKGGDDEESGDSRSSSGHSSEEESPAPARAPPPPPATKKP